jgi:hypothetical protein
MARTKGAKNKFPLAVKERVEHVFHELNGANNDALKRLERDHPSVFYGLVGKLIPQQATLAVSHTLIDLGDEMVRAANRLNDMRLANSIEHEDTPIPSQPVDIIEE